MTISKEDYLKAIYKLRKLGNVSNKILSKYLKISAASVTEMIKKLEKLEYVKYENKNIDLTEKGVEIAIYTIRKHRVWEIFLYNVLGVELENIHCEAEKLEHITSDMLLLKLEKFLFFPHNYKDEDVFISSKDYEKSIVNLSECKKGDKFIIISYMPNNELKVYLEKKDFNLKQIYEIIEIDEFDESFILKCETNNSISIGNKAAKMIEVYKIRKDR